MHYAFTERNNNKPTRPMTTTTRRISKEQEKLVITLISMKWCRNSKSILDRGGKPSKISWILENTTVIESVVDDWDVKLTKESIERIKKGVIERCAFKITNEPEWKDVLKYYLDSAKPSTPTQKSELRKISKDRYSFNGYLITIERHRESKWQCGLCKTTSWSTWRGWKNDKKVEGNGGIRDCVKTLKQG